MGQNMYIYVKLCGHNESSWKNDIYEISWDSEIKKCDLQPAEVKPMEQDNHYKMNIHKISWTRQAWKNCYEHGKYTSTVASVSLEVSQWSVGVAIVFS